MPYIALIAVIAILALQSSDAIPLASVGGSITIGLVFLAAALAGGIHEAWTKRRGVLGWLVNIIASFFGAMVGANFGGIVMVIIIGLTMDVNGSLAKTGGAAMSVALAGGMIASLMGAWGALWVVNRMR